MNAEEVIFTKDFTENVLDRTNKQIGTADYRLERDIGVFNGSFSRLVKIDENETRTILYDVTAQGYFYGAFQHLILGMFPVAIIVVIARKVLISKKPAQ